VTGEAEALRNNAEATAKQAKSWVVALIPFVKIKLEEKAKMLGKNADILLSAVQSIKKVICCHQHLKTFVEGLAKLLHDIFSSLQEVCSDGKMAMDFERTQMSAAAMRTYQRLRACASELVARCDLFLKTRLQYAKAMEVTQAQDCASEGFRQDWQDGLNLALKNWVK
jgi:hypothetical protein